MEEEIKGLGQKKRRKEGENNYHIFPLMYYSIAFVIFFLITLAVFIILKLSSLVIIQFVLITIYNSYLFFCISFVIITNIVLSIIIL